MIVARGENLHTSGLVLITPLEVEIHEDATSGRVRTTVKDTKKDTYISDVHIKVIGSSNKDFTSGDTDLRGVFVADGIQGTSTVIAQSDTGSYAFYRGEQLLAQSPPVSQPPAGQPAKAQPRAAQQAQMKGTGIVGGREKLLEQIFDDNTSLNQQQSLDLDKLYRSGKDSVEASAF